MSSYFSLYIFSINYYLPVFKNLYYLNFSNFSLFFVFSRLLSAYLKISTLPPDFAKCEQVCLFFRPIRFVAQTGFHIQHRPTKYFGNLAKVLHIFSAFLVVFQNIYMRILFNEFQRFLCAILFEILCWF